MMKCGLFVIAFAYSLLFCSCEQIAKRQANSHVDWIKADLPNNWTVYFPKGFNVRLLKPTDSKPGIIILPKDIMSLSFDCGGAAVIPWECSFEKDFEETNYEITNGHYKALYNIPKDHIGIIDTANHRVAIVIKPAITGHGTVAISISNCETGQWIQIEGANLALKNEQLALEIFKTLKLETK